MQNTGPIALTRDVEAAVVPVGTAVTLQKGEQAYITQSSVELSVVVNGNMFRIGKERRRLEFKRRPACRNRGDRKGPRPKNWRRSFGTPCAPVTTRKSRSTSWTSVSFDCRIAPAGDGSNRVDVK